MKNLKSSFLLFFVLLNSFIGMSQTETSVQTDLEIKLTALFPTAKITKIANLEGFSQSYELLLNEPLDHKHPEKGTFSHLIYLSHHDFNSPMVMVTEGYAARNVKNEITTLLDANQVIVEYRFYGKSRPNPIQWEFLTNDQAVEDYHVITKKLKTLYKGKWISTGISKGGETTLIYKSKYPKDVDIAIPYVAPLINTQEDPRTTAHINTVGTAECREKIIAFQRSLLQNRKAVLEEISAYAEKEKMTFTEVSMNEALEYAALEFSFSFWQWGGNCDEIPGVDATSKERFDYVNKIVGISFYSDKVYFDLLPSFYQHMSELGYYGFNLTPVEDLLVYVKRPSNDRFAPKVEIIYNPKYIKKVRKYAETKGDKILYIYGAYDPWFACAPNPNKNLDALKMVLPEGSHATRIKNFPPEDQQKITETLQRWLKN